MPTRRAIGIVRVSQVAGREGDSFASPGEQRDRIEVACERDSLTLITVHEELDVSGGKPLAQRPGLRRAVEAVEAGEAEVIVAAYFDRLMRSLDVQSELVQRVEKAGGRVLTVDMGELSHATAGQWLSGTMVGAVSEYYRRSVKERSGEAQARAVARGVVPWPRIPPGYQRGEGGRLVPDPASAPAVVEAFRMRARGETLNAIRAHLAEHGIKRSYHGVGALLSSRVVLGEIHFGKLVNLTAHDPIVDAELWRAVQRVSTSRGRRPKSERLLARLGVLRCGSCGARMVVGIARSTYPFYRCPPNGDCPRRVTISAVIAEEAVVATTLAEIADEEGRASVEANARDAAARLERAQQDVDAAIRAFAGLAGERAAVERLAELAAVRDSAQAEVDHLGGLGAVERIGVATDWDRLTVDEQRAIIRMTVRSAVVMPGRGADRLRVETFGQ